MKKNVFLIVLLFSFLSFAFSKSENKIQDEKLVMDLSGNSWIMEGTLPGNGVKNQFQKYMPYSSKVKVPGDVFTDLWRIGRIDDMNYGENAMKAKWVNEYEWWYCRYFDVPENMEDKNIRIAFDGVDYECDVYVNGHFLGNHRGMFSKFSYDITDFVNFSKPQENGENNYLAIRLAPAPRNISLVNGKKYRWCGDYNKNIVPTGIYRPVKLIATGQSRITDLYAHTSLNKNGSANVMVELELNNSSQSSQNIKANFVLTGENFKTQAIDFDINNSIKPGVNVIKKTILVKNPKFWWPWDLGDQNLYNLKVKLKSSNGDFQDFQDVTFGIREVKMAMNPGWTKKQVQRPWTVMINGKRHFVRSGTWGGPPDLYTGRTTEDTYRKLIKLAKDANINNLRIFNWHPVELPIFYKLCDQAGITVWQDMGMMNNNIIENDSINKAAFKEVVCSLKERRNHPCNIIIEGSEEILFVKSLKRRKYHWKVVSELGDTLKKYTDLYYIPTSPLSDYNGRTIGLPTNETAHPHGVHYGMGNILMEDYYQKQNFAAIPELAVSSCPNVESIKRFIPEDELWPAGPSWGYHWADMDILQGHNYEVFGQDFTDKSLQEFVDATQIAQGTYFQYAMELYRTRKPKMSAVCFCHFILNSPDFKWAVVDYYLQPKKSYDFIKKCYQPLLITLQYKRRRWMPNEEFQGKIWVVNDYMKKFKSCSAKIEILDNQKNLVETKNIKIGDINGDSSKEIKDFNFNVPGKKGDKFYVKIEMKDNSGKIVSANDYMLLVDSQEEALKIYQKYGKASRERKNKYGTNTNRYFPGYFDNSKSLNVEWLKVDK